MTFSREVEVKSVRKRRLCQACLTRIEVGEPWREPKQKDPNELLGNMLNLHSSDVAEAAIEAGVNIIIEEIEK